MAIEQLTCRVAERNFVIRAFTMGVARMSLMDGRFSCNRPKQSHMYRGLSRLSPQTGMPGAEGTQEDARREVQASSLLNNSIRQTRNTNARQTSRTMDPARRPWVLAGASRGVKDSSCAQSLAKPVKAQAHQGATDPIQCEDPVDQVPQLFRAGGWDRVVRALDNLQEHRVSGALSGPAACGTHAQE